MLSVRSGLASVIRVGVVGLAGLCAQLQICAAPGSPLASDGPSALSRSIGKPESAQLALGESVFNTVWVPAGTPGAARRGLGPLFNAASCAACHVNGGQGNGPVVDGPAPIALVIQLETPSAHTGAEADGDPVYGHVYNTSAVQVIQPEGAVTVRYQEIEGRYYPDGIRWHMRVPRYRLTGLTRGRLAAQTVIKPRIAPALFGGGLLEAVPGSAIGGDAQTAAAADRYRTAPMRGRFGWQGESLSIREQVTKALSREMGLTTADRSDDDCTAAEADCLHEPSGNVPEVSGELLDAIVAYVRTLAVPTSPVRPERRAAGAELFASLGCADCHRPELPVELTDATGTKRAAVIAPYTDLRLHDLGIEMADENAAGERVPSRWRTAPLWGLGYRMRTESHPMFLHDGRARSPEEAILWHTGEAAEARRKFMDLWGRPRETLLRWLETL